MDGRERQDENKQADSPTNARVKRPSLCPETKTATPTTPTKGTELAFHVMSRTAQREEKPVQGESKNDIRN